ncbi:MAG: hypothetical protein RMK20_15200, partial [Verrucomicrobiales bacterium]|nr:hypothetical protein [Verrucomicrobiales bacterium]
MKKTFVLMVALAALGCGRGKIAPGAVAREPGRPLPAGVQTIPVTAEEVSVGVDVVGTVSAAERV